MTTKIKIENGINYLNESKVLTQLPTNSLFDKGKVGCGGTTLALTSNEPYVICVPFVSLITNKVEQLGDKIFGLYGGILKNDLLDYLESTECPKIMVTYDSLKKLTEWINPSDYKLLVDEYHILFNHYSFRETAIQSLLKVYTQFKEYCFMTATPLESDFVLEELKDLPMVEAVWDDTELVKVNTVKCKNVLATTCGVINKFLDGRIDGNAYIFVNSVNFIKEVIEELGLTEDNCRVIYSKNNKTKLGISNGDTLDAAKKINLLTSTTFEGCDLYDENGYVFIISEGKRSNTLLDVSTSICQISGRIRDTKHFDEINHIYSATRYSDLTYDEFKKESDKNVLEVSNKISQLNGLDKELRTAFIKALDEYYIKADEDVVFSFDPNKAKIDLFNFKMTSSIYSLRVNINKEYKKYGFKPVDYNGASIAIELKDKTTESFKEAIEAIEACNNNIIEYGLLLESYCIKYPFLREAIKAIGFEGIKEANYVVTNIKRKLIATTDNSTDVKILNSLKLNINNGDFISSKSLKNNLTKVYVELGLKKTAKASDITNYYEVKQTKKWINNKTVSGYLIIRNKMIVK